MQPQRLLFDAVVQLVGHARGQGSHGLQLVRLHQHLMPADQLHHHVVHRHGQSRELVATPLSRPNRCHVRFSFRDDARAVLEARNRPDLVDT